MPELRHLRCFVAVADERNFTHAAARLHIAQQSLSATIQQLERELGVKLFDRTTRTVRLTRTGEAFLPSARHVIAEADRAFAIAASGASRNRELSVGFSFTLDDHVRYQLVAPFLAAHPPTRLRVHIGLTGELLDLLEAGDIDLAVAFCPLARQGIEIRTIMLVPVSVLLADGHRLAAREVLRISDLRDEPFVLAATPAGAGFNAWLLSTCRDAGFVPRTVMSPPVTMNIPLSDLDPDAVTLVVSHPDLAGNGNVLRQLVPEVTAPYAAAVSEGATGFVRDAFAAVADAAVSVSSIMRRRTTDSGAELTIATDLEGRNGLQGLH